MSQRERYEVGDVLRVSCPSARARVVGASAHHVSVEWPWGRIDPGSAIRWNGRRALPRVDDASEWSLFRTDPAPAELDIGDTCLVGVPEQLVEVVDVGYYDPPLDVGWVPRPYALVIVLPVGHPRVPGAEEEGDTIELGSAAPFAVELVSRGGAAAAASWSEPDGEGDA
jgi:hypothetical protein